MHWLLRPATSPSPSAVKTFVLVLLVASAVLVVLAATKMPPPYSWKTHSISESAAQGMAGAWVGRASFLAFGSAVLCLSIASRSTWGRVALWLHLVFAGCMFGTAAFSHKPWLPGVPSDEFEDSLHSLTATLMGFAFAGGVVVRLIQRRKGQAMRRTMDLLALVCATALSPIGLALPEFGGVVQRSMFLVAYVWYAFEALELGPATAQGAGAA